MVVGSLRGLLTRKLTPTSTLAVWHGAMYSYQARNMLLVLDLHKGGALLLYAGLRDSILLEVDIVFVLPLDSKPPYALSALVALYWN